ncbi:hypothetical protein RB195_002014 [Necator americanus]|uniref:Uncharacterized protein n=1 Tax=Necator americanus TaxID=51031 RepID=A0ABR1DGZ9_NECAM
MGFIIASTFRINYRRDQLTLQGSTLSTPKEQRKRKMRDLELQFDYALTRNISYSGIRKSKAVSDVAFDSDHLLLSFKIRLHKKNRGAPLQPKIDMAGLKDEGSRTKFHQRENKPLRRPVGYFWHRLCHNEDIYAEVDVVYRQMTRGRYQHLAPPSKEATENYLRFLGHALRRPLDRSVQRVLGSLSGSSWKRPPG